MSEQVNGHILAPRNAAKYPASLLLGTTGLLTLQSDCYTYQCLLAETTLSPSIGNMARTITFESGHVFVCQQPEQLNPWLRKHGNNSLIAKLERNFLLIIVASIVVATTGYMLFTQGVPLAAKTLAHMLPESVEQTLNEQSLNTLDQMGFTESALPKDRQLALQAVFQDTLQRLNAQSVRFATTPELLFRTSELGANAFALAGGQVVLTDDMVKLAKDDSQLQAVILHELGHLYHRHTLTNIVQSAMLSVGVAMIVGETSGISDTLVSVAVMGTSLSYSREHEREADQFAADKLNSWYQNTDSLIALYQSLMDDKNLDIPTWLSTHPQLQQRILYLQQYPLAKEDE